MLQFAIVKAQKLWDNCSGNFTCALILEIFNIISVWSSARVTDNGLQNYLT